MNAAPPALEFKEFPAAADRIGEEIIILAKIVAAGIEHLEIRHEMGAVELAVSDIR